MWTFTTILLHHPTSLPLFARVNPFVYTTPIAAGAAEFELTFIHFHFYIRASDLFFETGTPKSLHVPHPPPFIFTSLLRRNLPSPSSPPSTSHAHYIPLHPSPSSPPSVRQPPNVPIADMGSNSGNILATDADTQMPTDERLIQRLAALGKVCTSLSLFAPTSPASYITTYATPKRPTEVMYV